jgi:hypothetical protein
MKFLLSSWLENIYFSPFLWIPAGMEPFQWIPVPFLRIPVE